MLNSDEPAGLANCDLFAVDLDGTLLDSRGKLPTRNRAALHAAHNAGIRIVLCTGRSLPETEPVIRDIGLDLDAVVTSSGALVSDARTGVSLTSFLMPIPLATRICTWARENRLTPLWLLDRHEHTFDGYAVGIQGRHPALTRWLAKSPCVMRDVDRMPDPLATPLRIAVVDDSDVLARAAQTLCELVDCKVDYNLLIAKVYEISVLEIFAPDVNKWNAVRWLCDRWGIAPQHTVGIGDDVNDIALISSAGIGFAMENAQQRVLELTPHRALSNDACGVADVLERILKARNG